MAGKTRLTDMYEQLGEFRAALVAEDMSPAAVSSYVGNVWRFARWYAETYDQAFVPSEVVQRDVQEHRAWMQGVPYAAETVNRRLVSIRKFFDWLGINPNPAAAVRGVTIVDPGVQALSIQEFRRLLREVHRGGDRRDIAIVELLAHTGMRVGELVSLGVADIELMERKGSVKIRHGKGGVSREIPLNADVRSALRAYLSDRSDASDQSGRLFRGQRGDLTCSGVQRLVRKYGNMAGIDRLRVHQLRHTVLTRLVWEQGIDLATVARISGHSSMKTLMRYAAPTQEDMQRAMESLALVGGE